MIRKTVVEVIAALLILLWVYAAVSKLIAYDSFRLQLSKSPLLTNFPGFVAVSIPMIELGISFTLVFTKWRLPGFYLSFILLITFSAYLVAILNFSYYIPCSCGGILKGMSWKTHIVFNLGYALLALIGILLTKQVKDSSTLENTVPL
ncbi:MauE/DoxX family redox-associated membrane protein [Pedobacter sp. MC2016-24]|uniref:MauE/DoxX family redox-associated membrane protein n=1 Tax=Pedobacter sp. MC2016-24 TaxID=2780090 RepID=UPI001880A80C|nr:hypothetical protein [Pedobacter sp. MC2016-24]